MTDQAHQFDDEMERINFEIYTLGQPEIDHHCEKCVRTVVVPTVADEDAWDGVAEKEKDVEQGNRIAENGMCTDSILFMFIFPNNFSSL